MRHAGSIAPMALLLFGCSLAGCTQTTGPGPAAVIVATEPTGTLVVSWTIELHADRNACAAAAVSTVRVHLTTAGGSDGGTYEEVCPAFSTSIDLVPATYQGTAVLLDAMGAARTSPVPLQAFTILGGDVITTPVDFTVTTFMPN